jgi:hypothetical protein
MSKEGKKFEVKKNRNMERENLYQRTEALVEEAYGEVRSSRGEVRFMDNKERAEEILANLSVFMSLINEGTPCVRGVTFLDQKVFVVSNFVRFGGVVDNDFYSVALKKDKFENKLVVLSEVQKALMDRTKEKNVSEEEKQFFQDEWLRLNGLTAKNF